jgi:hypothetical protein
MTGAAKLRLLDRVCLPTASRMREVGRCRDLAQSTRCNTSSLVVSTENPMTSPDSENPNWALWSPTPRFDDVVTAMSKSAGTSVSCISVAICSSSALRMQLRVFSEPNTSTNHSTVSIPVVDARAKAPIVSPSRSKENTS